MEREGRSHRASEGDAMEAINQTIGFFRLGFLVWGTGRRGIRELDIVAASPPS